MLTLVMAWIAMTYLGVDGMTNGDPDILLNGIDYDGRICGVDEGVTDKPKVGRRVGMKVHATVNTLTPPVGECGLTP